MRTDISVLRFVPPKTWLLANTMAHGELLAAGKKAVHAMQRQCISLICLILPPYASCLTFWCTQFEVNVLAVSPKARAKAELVHR